MVAGKVTVHPLYSLPADIDGLLEASLDEGHNLVKRFVDDWVDGSNQFAGPGEIAIEVRVDGHLAGVGGLNRDPFLDDATVARLRHLYVHPEQRRIGVGRAIVHALVDHARIHFSRVRLRTTPEEAARFYMALGFHDSGDEPDATHVLEL